MGLPIHNCSPLVVSRRVIYAVALIAACGVSAPAQAATLSGAVYDAPVAASSSYHTVSANTQNARKFIDTMAGSAIEFLGNKNMAQSAKRQAFDKLLRESFDMDTIGRFALGRYWRTATDAQRKEYMNLFRRMVLDVYSARFSEYNGQKFETRGARPEGERDVLVTSFIVQPNGPEVQVDWRVREKDGRYRVVDVLVEGVSMAVTQRSDFSAVIQRGGGEIEVLLQHLREKTR